MPSNADKRGTSLLRHGSKEVDDLFTARVRHAGRGELYYTVRYYADTDPHEFAWGDYFTYTPGMEGPLLEAVARQLAAEIPLTYPVPATTPSIDGQQLVGLDTWLWIDPAGWQPVELALDPDGGEGQDTDCSYNYRWVPGCPNRPTPPTRPAPPSSGM